MRHQTNRLAFVAACAWACGNVLSRLSPAPESAQRSGGRRSLSSASQYRTSLQNRTSPEAARLSHEHDISLLALMTGTPECTTPFDETAGVLLYSFVMLYSFVGLAILCDDYFCESLEKICDALRLSEDVAGATFMAAGSSAPELVTAIITIFVAPGHAGVGTIVGSAVFNLCVIVGLSCLCSSRPLELFWWPVARDVVIYTVSIVTMLVVMFDGLVSALEGGLMTLLYVVYLALMVFNQRIIAAIGGDKRARPEPRKGLVTVELSAQLESVTAHLGAERRHDIDWRPMEVTSFGGSAPPSHDASTSSEPAAAAAPASGGEDLGVDDAEDGDGGLASRVGAIISTPLRLLLKATVPDCREERWAKWYGGRFVLGRASFQPVISPRPPPTHPQVHGHVCYVSVPHWRLLLHYG